MSLPTHEEIIPELLRLAYDGQEHSLEEAAKHVAGRFKLSPEKAKSLLTAGEHSPLHEAYSKLREGDLLHCSSSGTGFVLADWFRRHLQDAEIKARTLQATDDYDTTAPYQPLEIALWQAFTWRMKYGFRMALASTRSIFRPNSVCNPSHSPKKAS